jgi:hypothetical protein
MLPGRDLMPHLASALKTLYHVRSVLIVLTRAGLWPVV